MEKRRSLGTLLRGSENEGSRTRRLLNRAANALAERLLAVHRIRGIYESLPACKDPFEFTQEALKALDVEPVVRERDLGAIPHSGPAVVVANHPFGGIDGLILISVLSRVRRDFKILANYFLGAIPDLEPVFFLVDPFGRKTSPAKNMAVIKQVIKWVKQGGMLVVFPAGEVSHLTWRSSKVQDPAWNDTAVRLVQSTKAPVVPVYFEGRNSKLFQAAGLVHPLLRTLMLPRELLKKRSSKIKLKIGSVIPYRRLKAFEKAADLREYLRFRTCLLALAFRGEKKLIRLPMKLENGLKKMETVMPQQEPMALRKEVDSLPPDQKLISGNEFEVYHALAGQIPRLMKEIGRLREETFRMAGEGTGKAVDLDRFDNIYIHLFVWNREKNEVVGAYRLGATDEILAKHGKKGLYTQTLFRYHHRLLKEMGPALEMGRTFVRKEYQRSYSPLLLLWKGIGQYVVAHPRYRILFGAVSISNDYHSYSRQLMVAFLSMNRSMPDLGKMVKPRKPFRTKQVSGLHWVNEEVEEGLDELSAWISGVEKDGKGVPVLLKQYLKLGGKVLSFNVDKRFGNALDGLILVDLALTDPKILKRYMGDDGFNTFMHYHTEQSLPAIFSHA